AERLPRAACGFRRDERFACADQTKATTWNPASLFRVRCPHWMQGEDICAKRDGEVGRAGLQRIVRANGDDGEGVWRRSGTRSGVNALSVDCAARTSHRASGSLNLPEHALIAGAENSSGKLLHGQ